MPGLPLVDTLAQFGGQKANRQQPANAAFDYDALQLNQALSDVAGLTHTGFRAILIIQLGSFTDGYVPSIVSWDATWKINTPTTPIIANIAAGKATITFPTSVTDENGSINTLNFIGGLAQLVGVSSDLTRPFFSCTVSASVNVINVFVGTEASGLSDSFHGNNIFIGMR